MAHPYYPVRKEIEGYLANANSTLTLLSIFAAGCISVAMSAYILMMRLYPRSSFGDLWTIVWFALCGCVHLFFEGYFAYNFRRMPAMTDVFGQLWKEYSLSDSRYQTQSAFVLCMESVTAFIWGPLSFVMVFLIIRDHPLRHAVQLIVSLGQLYGVILYYATSLFDHYVLDIENSRPESLRFWGYFIVCNAFWVIVPSILLCTSLLASKRAFVSKANSERPTERCTEIPTERSTERSVEIAAVNMTKSVATCE